MTDILNRVRLTIETHSLLGPGDGVVVGVSGGPDSLCLLHILLRLREQYRLRLYAAHFHHGARGTDADADAEFVTALAHEWGLPVTVEKQDIPALARAHKLAFEEMARRVRYAFLARVAGNVDASTIAVGHNADDQAETVLMHFLRGAGPAGLRGMLPLTSLSDYRLLDFPKQPSDQPVNQPVCIIRPLLGVSRLEIERYCTVHGITPRFDRSNLDTTYFRNRLRHELLPLLETYNPNIRTRLCHTAAVVAADYELLAQMREQAWAEVIREEYETSIVFDKTRWRALPVALQRNTVRQGTYQLRRSLRDVDFAHVENARKVGLRGRTGAQATLPMGLTLTVGYDTLTIGDSEAAVPPLPLNQPLLWSNEPLPVQVPGETPLPGSSWTLRAEVLEEWDPDTVVANPDPWTAYFDVDRIISPLLLRSRRPGDRLRPQGMEGHSVKLSAFMVNLKIPRAWRDHIPLLVAGGKIVWVCGQRIAEGTTVGAETRQIVRLCFARTSQDLIANAKGEYHCEDSSRH